MAKQGLPWVKISILQPKQVWFAGIGEKILALLSCAPLGCCKNYYV